MSYILDEQTFELSSTNTQIEIQHQLQNSKNIKSKSQNKKDSQRKRQKWTPEETAYYCKFLLINRKTLQQPQKKDKQKIFNKMAATIISRNSRQCKSHHQKLLQKFITIDKILQKLDAKQICENSSCYDELLNQKMNEFEQNEEKKVMDNYLLNIVTSHEIEEKLFELEDAPQIYVDTFHEILGDSPVTNQSSYTNFDGISMFMSE